MGYLKTTRAAAAGAVAIALFAVSCSSGSSGSGKPTGSSSGSSSKAATQSITVGVLTDATGVASSANKTFEDGIKAGVVYAARNGINLKYVVADSQTSPSAILSGAQKLVTQDHVPVVLAVSSLTFAAAPYLTAKHIPVIGAAADGPEWAKSTNMFAISGQLHTDRASTIYGDFFKQQGVTTVGTLGYGISPTSADFAQIAATSAKHAGLKVGYVNTKFPFGSTNVQPVAAAMKSAGVDGFTAAVDPNTGFALVTSLRQSGSDPKVSLLPTGYGGDVQQAGPGALQAAQNVYFFIQGEPVEMQTPATKQFEADLRSAGIKGEPTYAMYNGYLSVGLLVRALKSAGPNATAASITTALNGIHNYDGLGLWGGRTSDPNDRNKTSASGENCLWFTKLVGTTFQVVKSAAPLCGTDIPGGTG
jgi:branched-chain amino acid transport system substrate-binding protein